MHRNYGDLTRPDSVRMVSSCSKVTSGYCEDKGIIINLTVTGRCYARCEGCINRAITFGAGKTSCSTIETPECVPERDANMIFDLVSTRLDVKATVAFYGGEPFLAADKMDEVRARISTSEVGSRVRFMVYTNGEMLIRGLRDYPELMRSMWLYSVSIDGDETQHRRFRQGTDLSVIRNNLRELRSVYDGNILFWSTLREPQSLGLCFEEFLRLYEEGLVNHFFWHWAEAVEPYHDLTAYLSRYEADLEEIMKVYVERCSLGEVLPVAHLNELILFLITGKERGHTACGVELADNYDIIGGRVCACSDLPASYSNIDLNSGRDSIKERLNTLVAYKKDLGCYSCGVHAYCGGRCPVQPIVGSPERARQICQLMRLHVGIVQGHIGEIVASITRQGVSLQEIYDRSASLAHYTDVVP